MSGKIRRAPFGVSSGVLVVGTSLAVPMLLQTGALAGPVRPAPGHSVSLVSAVGHCGSHFAANYGPVSGCSGLSVALENCPDSDAETVARAFSLEVGERVDSARAAGVQMSENLPLSIVHEVDPSVQTPIMRTRVAAQRGANDLWLDFEVVRRSIDSLTSGSDRVLEASVVDTSAGIAVLGELDRLEARVDLEVLVRTTLRIDGVIGSVDVRTNQSPGWRSELQWEIRSSTDTRIAGCAAAVSETDQLASLDLGRTPPVSPSGSSNALVALEPGTYRLTVSHMRTLVGPLVSLNGCQTVFGSWAERDEASLSVSVAVPSDVDGSGVVDYGDVSLTLLDYGAGEGASDVDGNGVVDSGDVALVLLEYGTEVPQATPCS
ncbi:MAG: hypothetical protein ACOYMI_02060 [Phycisphaerales bacterium]